MSLAAIEKIFEDLTKPRVREKHISTSVISEAAVGRDGGLVEGWPVTAGLKLHWVSWGCGGGEGGRAGTITTVHQR